jgi:dienelactone hydrolase
MPNLFNDNPIPLNPPAGFNVFEWLGGFPPEKIDHIAKLTIDALRTTYEAKKIGAAGYCFGGKCVVRTLKDQVSVGYTAHPNMVDEAELAQILGPLSLSAAGNFVTSWTRPLTVVLLRSSALAW